MRRLALVCLFAATAHAQPADDATARAKALYDEGSKHYTLGEYREAVGKFRAAYDLLPDALFLFNIAQSYRQLNECDQARTFYKSYLRTEPTADNRDQVERFITAMDECVKKKDAERDAALRAQQPTIVTRADHAGLRIAGYVTGAAGLLMLGGGVYFSLDARDQAREVENLCSEGCTTSDIAAIDRKGLDSERDAIILYVAGGAAIAAGIGMVVWARMKDRESVVVTPTPNGVSAAVRF